MATTGIEPALLPSAEGLNWRSNHSATEAHEGALLSFYFLLLMFGRESIVTIFGVRVIESQ